MEHFELVEKLRQKANISYEEAKNALEQNDWDLLDALVYLESQNKVHQEPADSYTTKKEERAKAEPQQDFRGGFTRVMSYLAELINKSSSIYMDISRHGKVVLSLPLLVPAILLIFFFWWVVPILAIGLFFGFRYSFRGHEAAGSVNKAMDKAAQTAENIKSNIHRDDTKDGE